MKAIIKKPKILIFDIETSPLITRTWGTRDQNIALNQIVDDWSIIAFAAKWYGDPESSIVYYDVRNQRNFRDDKKLLKKLVKLMDKADIVLGQNSDQFDIKKVNARCVINGIKPISSYRKLDTVKIARRHFGFTSNKLEYMTKKLNKKYTKLSHAKFPGMELWNECLAGNKEAWKEMEIYNKHDVLATEELFKILSPWDNSINYNVYSDTEETCCSSCGEEEFVKNGFHYTNFGKYQRWKCLSCNAEMRDKHNLIETSRRRNLLARIR